MTLTQDQENCHVGSVSSTGLTARVAQVRKMAEAQASEEPESRAPEPRISTGEPKRHYISEAVRHVQMRQGTIGIKALSLV